MERVKAYNKDGGSMRREEVGTAVTEQQQLPYFLQAVFNNDIELP